MNLNLSLRERKKYQTMVSILDEFLRLLGSNHFNEIRIEDVCNKVNISKVTFFRYFSSKEEVLDYFVLRWCYRRSVEIHNGTFQGIEGIRHVFKSTAEIPNAQKILVSLLQYYSKLNDKPAKKELSEYERYIISQNSAEGIHVNILSISVIFRAYLSQIEDLSEVRIALFTDHLVALFYGIPFQVHIQLRGSEALLQAYMDSLDILFGNNNRIKLE